jgi:hypothetical protein
VLFGVLQVLVELAVELAMAARQSSLPPSISSSSCFHARRILHVEDVVEAVSSSKSVTTIPSSVGRESSAFLGDVLAFLDVERMEA